MDKPTIWDLVGLHSPLTHLPKGSWDDPPIMAPEMNANCVKMEVHEFINSSPPHIWHNDA